MSSDAGVLLGEALPSFLITFREGLEAFLLVGIMLSYLDRVNAQRYKRHIFYGVGAGLVTSLLAAFAFQVVVSQFENDYYRSCLMIGILLFASGVLTYMAVWMQRQARARSSEMQRQLDAHVSAGNLIGMVSLSFAAVLREGIETVLFFSALAYSPQGLRTDSALTGGLLGVAASIALVYALLRGSRRVPLTPFFKYTSLLLIVIAAGLLSSSIDLMQSLRWLPMTSERLFDISWILRDDVGIGIFLRALFGYNAAPSGLQFVVWTGYLALFVLLWRRAYATSTA
jgi:high-affinity iron transporter